MSGSVLQKAADAGIKVFAIMAFLLLGTLFVIGLWPGQGFDVSNLSQEGGFLPNGVGAIFSSTATSSRSSIRVL